MDEQKKSEFIRGVHKSALPIDKEAFSIISEIIESEVGTGGHDYIPEEFEFRVSSIPYCSRKILFKKDPKKFLSDEQIDMIVDRFEGEQPLNESTAGQLIHETFQDALLKKLGSKVRVEEEISLTVNSATLKGHYDLLLEMGNKEQIVIDIKTTNSRQIYLPKLSHLRQLMAYQGILGGVRGAILYVHRNNFEMSYYPQEFDKKTFSDIVVKITNLAKWEKEARMPPRNPALPDECGTEFWKCDYHKICYPEYYIPLDEFEVIEED